MTLSTLSPEKLSKERRWITFKKAIGKAFTPSATFRAGLDMLKLLTISRSETFKVEILISDTVTVEVFDTTDYELQQSVKSKLHTLPRASSLVRAAFDALKHSPEFTPLANDASLLIYKDVRRREIKTLARVFFMTFAVGFRVIRPRTAADFIDYITIRRIKTKAPNPNVNRIKLYHDTRHKAVALEADMHSVELHTKRCRKYSRGKVFKLREKTGRLIFGRYEEFCLTNDGLALWGDFRSKTKGIHYEKLNVAELYSVYRALDRWNSW